MIEQEVDELFQEVRRVGGLRPFALRSAIAFVFYTIPAAALSLLLMRLTEGALWVPTEWRSIILMLGFLGGMACFTLARNQVRNRFRAPTGFASDAASATVRAVFERESKDRHFARKRFAMTRALVWLAPTTLFIGLFAFVKAECVLEWMPERKTVYTLLRSVTPQDPILPPLLASIEQQRGAGPRTVTEAAASTERMALKSTSLAAFDGDWQFEYRSAFLAFDEGAFRGSILVPLGFPRTETAKELMQAEYAAAGAPKGKTPVQFTLEESPVNLIDTVHEAERGPLGRTRFLFVAIHLALLLCASTAYGYSYSRAEDVATAWFSPDA